MVKFIIALWSLIWVTDVYAYLDPGTGSLVIQSLIASVTGGLFLIKTYWHKIKEKLLSVFNKETESDNDK